jgi:hypothetical protein
MRRFFAACFVFLLFLATAGSCGAKDDPSASADGPAFAPVAVWLEPHPAFRPDDAAAGCAFWCFKGASCRVVADPALATVLVRADRASCARAADGTFHLGDAWLDADKGVATVNLRVDCFRNEAPRSLVEPYDRAKVRSVLAHELGHTFGIWDHVPDGCAGAHKTRADGAEACGDALMNALWEPATPCPTFVDAIAFDVRDEKLTVLRPARAHDLPVARCLCDIGPF